MTIFDIKPYSYWRNLYRTAYRGWVNLGHDTPRTVLRLCLLEYLLRYQQDIIDRLSQQNGPQAPRIGVRQPDLAAGGVAPEIDPLQSATNEGSDHAATA